MPVTLSRFFFALCGRISLLTLAMSVLIGLSSPERACAQARSEYDSAIERAVEAYNDADYEEAAKQFQLAHERSPNARTLRGIGMARFELGDYSNAADALEAALTSNVAPLEGQLRTETQRLLREALTHVARLHIEIEPRNAQVAVDGALREDALDGPIVVSPGAHLLEVQAPGYELVRKSIKAEAGRDLALEISLSRIGEQQERRRWLKNPWLWVGASVVVAGVVVSGLALAGRFDRESSDRGNGIPIIQLLPRSPQ